MTNDNIHVTNAQVAEASALPIDKPIEDFFDADGNLIPFDVETFTQTNEDIKVDTGNTSH